MEDKIYSVAVSCRGVNGWVEYDTEAKTVKVFLDDEKAVADAEKFLSEKHVIKVPHESLLDFTENTEVHVDWSRPVEYVKAHPTLD